MLPDDELLLPPRIEAEVWVLVAVVAVATAAALIGVGLTAGYLIWG